MPHPSISLVPDDCYPYLSLPVRVRAGAISCVFWTRVRGDLHVPGDTSLTIPPRNPINDLRKSCQNSTRYPLFMCPQRDIPHHLTIPPRNPTKVLRKMTAFSTVETAFYDIFYGVSRRYGERYRTGTNLF